MTVQTSRVDRVIGFITTHCRHTKGKWAGRPFKLLDWQRNLLTQLFGETENGKRKYRFCYCEIPKKNGKSELAAAIALYMLCGDGEQGAEVYSAAADRNQASLVFNVAVDMVRMDKILSKKLRVVPSRKQIHYPAKSGIYQVLSAEVYTKHGINPSAIIFDELHAQPNDELWRVLTSGTDYAREQQIVFTISTAGIYDINSIWWRIREKARQISEGILDVPDFLPVLYIADQEKDDPEDRELWRRVNPSLGTIFSMRKIERDFATAKQDPVEWVDFLRYRLNIPVNQINRWLPIEHWDKCKGQIDIDILKGRRCYGGLDLSSKIDLTAFILIFEPLIGDEIWDILPFFYVPQDTLLKRSKEDNVPYDIWAKQGLITATPGNCIDNEFIKRDIIQASKDYDIIEIGFDPWKSRDLAIDLLNNCGIRMVEIPQTFKYMSESSGDLLEMTLKHQFNHGKHPVLRWCADNLVMIPNSKEDWIPAKNKSTDRIDGMVALIMAINRAKFHEKSVSTPIISFA